MLGAFRQDVEDAPEYITDPGVLAVLTACGIPTEFAVSVTFSSRGIEVTQRRLDADGWLSESYVHASAL